MSIVINIDWETYSAAGYTLHADGRVSGKGISEVGAYRYAEHPTTDLLWLSYRWLDQSRLWREGDRPPQELFDLIARPDTVLAAFNWQFEWAVWTQVAHIRRGWPYVPPEKFVCSAARARRYGVGGGLELAGQVLADEGKDPAGKKLISLFSKPNKPSKSKPFFRTLPAYAPDEFQQFGRYCDRDTLVERLVAERCPELTPFEQQWFAADQRIVTRGVQLDLPLLDAMIREHQHLCAEADAQLAEITGGEVTATTQAVALARWCTAQGVPTDSVAEEQVDKILDSPDTPPHVADALRCRLTAASANIRKAYALRARASFDGRYRGGYTIWGATQTGRYSSEGAQLQNLASLAFEYLCETCGVKHVKGGMCCGVPLVEVPWNEQAVNQLADDIMQGDLTRYDRPINALVAAVRATIVSPEGRVLIDADYSSIESVVTAALAGCEWRLDVFRRGECIYTHSAADIMGKTYEWYQDYKRQNGKHHKDRKTVGKVAELASGFQGWIGAWRQFGHTGTDDEIKEQILAWRKKSSEIVEMWGGQIKKIGGEWVPYLYGLEGAAIAAIRNPGTAYAYRSCSYCVVKGVLECTLISGLKLYYHNPRLGPGRPHYSGVPTVSVKFDGYNTDTKKGPRGWITLDTYGGRLFENVVQAVAAHIMANGMINADRRGLSIVMTTHDQITCEESYDRLDELIEAMCDVQEWARDWPIKAVGFATKRFYKD